MKLDKNQQKQLVDAIHMVLEKKGYKIKTNTIYTIKGNAFIHCDFLIVNSQKMVYRIYIKDYDYDDIFWKIMQMPDNTKKNDSLRAVCAFKAPSILLKKGEIDFADKFEEQAEFLVEQINKCSHDFMKQYDIDEYIVDNESGMDKEILKCLAYLHMEQPKDAIKIARDSIDCGDRGNYENEGKNFFDWILLRYQ